jgi:hypothetical protein
MWRGSWWPASSAGRRRTRLPGAALRGKAAIRRPCPAGGGWHAASSPPAIQKEFKNGVKDLLWLSWVVDASNLDKVEVLLLLSVCTCRGQKQKQMKNGATFSSLTIEDEKDDR